MTKTTNKETHLKRITEAIDELGLLEKRTKSPAQLPHQYIGTIVDNTIGLLTAPANSLDDGNRTIKFTEDNNWISLMQAVHRSFLSSLHIAVEIGLEKILEDRHTIVESSFKERANKKLERFKNIDTGLKACIDDLIKNFQPTFEDKINAVLNLTSLNKKDKKIWREFFKGMTIVRNKVSHSDPTLRKEERNTLKEGGLATLVSNSGDLQVNPRMYNQFATFSLDFFDKIYSNMK